MPFAFGRALKMRKTDEFSSVFRFRCVAGGPGLDVLAAPNGLDQARLGLIVPKKVIATAVARNRIKRLLREAFRLHQAELTGLDVIARIKSRVSEDRLQQAFLAGMPQCASCVNQRLRSLTRAPSPGPDNLTTT